MMKSILIAGLLLTGSMAAGTAQAGHDDYRYSGVTFSYGYGSSHDYGDRHRRHGHRHDRHCRHGRDYGRGHGNHNKSYRQGYGRHGRYERRQYSHVPRRHQHRHGIYLRIGSGYEARRYRWCGDHGGYYLRGDLYY